MKEKRIEYIDVFRAFGIILMIMGHIWFGVWFDKFIHAFHMPMFFIISGYFCKCDEVEEKFKFWLKYVIKEAKALLVPYWVFGIFHCLISYILNFGNNELLSNSIIHLLFINNKGLPIAGALWFLTCLFLVTIIFKFLQLYIKNKFVMAGVIVVIALMGNVLPKVTSVELLWSLEIAFVGLGLYYIGYIIHKYENVKLIKYFFDMNWYVLVSSGVLTVISIFINKNINMRELEYGIIPLFWINAVLAKLIGLNISRLIYNVLGRCKTKTRFKILIGR